MEYRFGGLPQTAPTQFKTHLQNNFPSKTKFVQEYRFFLLLKIGNEGTSQT